MYGYYIIKHLCHNFEITEKNKGLVIKDLKRVFDITQKIQCKINTNDLFSNVSSTKNGKLIKLKKGDTTFCTLIHEFIHIKKGQEEYAHKIKNVSLFRLYNLISDIKSCYWREIYFLWINKNRYSTEK